MLGRQVLVVDDNVDAADSMGVLLEMLGANVRVVYSGEAALESLDTFKPAAVLLDIGMPEMDGYEVARRIRAHPGFEDIVLIAITGWGQAEDRRRSQEAGFDEHLTKPPDLQRLKHVLLPKAQNAHVKKTKA